MTSAPTSETSPADGPAEPPAGGPDGRANGSGAGTDGADGAHAGGPGREYAIVVATRDDGGERQFLMVHHRVRGWELPGGKLEGREGPVHAALREFREETGHLLQDPRFVMKLPKPNGLCYVFTGSLGAKVGEVHDAEAVGAMRWHSRLPPVAELAFPEDPYDEMGDALGIDFGHDAA